MDHLDAILADPMAHGMPETFYVVRYDSDDHGGACDLGVFLEHVQSRMVNARSFDPCVFGWLEDEVVPAVEAAFSYEPHHPDVSALQAFEDGAEEEQRGVAHRLAMLVLRSWPDPLALFRVGCTAEEGSHGRALARHRLANEFHLDDMTSTQRRFVEMLLRDCEPHRSSLSSAALVAPGSAWGRQAWRYLLGLMMHVAAASLRRGDTFPHLLNCAFVVEAIEAADDSREVDVLADLEHRTVARFCRLFDAASVVPARVRYFADEAARRGFAAQMVQVTDAGLGAALDTVSAV